MKLISSAALAALFLVFSNAQATELTGCLTIGGLLKLVAEDSVPAKPCGPNETQVTLGGGGGVGPPGPPGPSGGGGQVPLMLTMHLPGDMTTSGGIISKWRECSSILEGRPGNTSDLMSLPVDPTITSAPGLVGWIQPHIVAAAGSEIVDITGIVSRSDRPGGFVCRSSVTSIGWASGISAHYGMETGFGTTELIPCNSQRAIICAIPIP